MLNVEANWPLLPTICVRVLMCVRVHVRVRARVCVCV